MKTETPVSKIYFVCLENRCSDCFITTATTKPINSKMTRTVFKSQKLW